MERNRDLPYMTPEQSVIWIEVHAMFLNILIGRDKLLQSYEITGNNNFYFTLRKKASFVALREISWERAIDSIVKSLERTLTNNLLYIYDEQERKEFLQEAYTLILEVNKLKEERPSVLDNLPPPFRITLAKAQESEGSPS